MTATRAADSNFNAVSSAATTVTLFGTKYWAGSTSTLVSAVTSAAFTAPTGETVLILATYEGANNRTCATPTGTANLTAYATVLAPAAWYTTGGDYRMCAYSGKGSNTAGTITETFSGTTTSATIQVIEITGDNSASFAIAKTDADSPLGSTTPAWLLTGPPTSTTEFLFGDLTNGATPPTWSAITGFAPVSTLLSVGAGTKQHSPTVYLGAPGAATVNGLTSATANWGTIGIEVNP